MSVTSLKVDERQWELVLKRALQLSSILTLRVHVTARVLNFLFLALVPFLYTVMDPELMWLPVLKFDRFRDYRVNGRQNRTTV